VRAASSVILSSPARAGELSQYVEVGQAQPGVLPKIGVELAHERSVRLQQRTPRQLSAPTRQRLIDKPAERNAYITR